MKNIRIGQIFLIVAMMLICNQKTKAEKLDFAIISDVHVMSPSLLIKDGSAFHEYVMHDRKMLKESPALLEAVTEKLLEEKPQFVLLTGDLTKDGEEVSHKYLVENSLRRLKDAGIQTLVIPGNHDVNNPHAVSFDGEKKERVKTISAADFAEIYSDYGYGKAIARDNSSLSYVYQITPNTRILALDACRYEDNDFQKDICRHEGRIRTATWTFIEHQLDDARQKGMRVIAMMHHGLVEHWKYQNKVIPGYVVDDNIKLCKLLESNGVRIMFTGHSHAQDIARHGKIYDIETGSTVSYPVPYRRLTLDGEELKIKTNLITSINFNLEKKSLQDYAREYAAQGVKTIISGMFPAKVPADIKEQCTSMVANAMTANYGGDEKLTEQVKKEIKDIAKILRKYSFKLSLVFKAVSESMLTDKEPEDNNITITIDK